MTYVPPYTLTNESITVVYNGTSHTVQKGSPQFKPLKMAIMTENWGDVPNHLTLTKSVESWAQGKFQFDGGSEFLYDGKTLPLTLNGRIMEMATAGDDPTALFKFCERLQNNPSKRSVDQLWSFLAHKGIPLQKDGTFLAYKGVRSDFKDQHSGNFDNSPGNVHSMPRNQISDDPQEACHEGFHVGALEYASNFSARVVVCEVDPADVVCVPYDASAQKMRVCKYKVIGHHSGQALSSTVHEEEDVDLDWTDPDEYVEEYAASAEDTTEAKPKRRSKRGYAKYDKMDLPQLLKQPIETLRQYATKGLQIVGASKILGGKIALVYKILEVR